jgi:co-chaperonin GroES (HSP10)
MIPRPVNKSGEIIIPDDVAAKLKTYDVGVVEAIGDTAFNYASDSKELCKVGDRVYIIQWAGVVLAENAGYSIKKKEDQVTYRIVNDEDILCVEVESDE